MVIKIFGHRDQRNIFNLISKGSIAESYIYSSVVILAKLFLLQEFILFLYLFKRWPLFFEVSEAKLGSTFQGLIFNLIQLFFWPEAGNIAYFRESFDHLVPKIIFFSFSQQEKSIYYDDLIIINLIFIVFVVLFLNKKSFFENLC